ncbi:IS110 family transposase, partial [Pseudomonas syringae pv. actinidifoliorum]
MAMRVSQEKMIIGVDVAKNELVIYHEQYDQLEAIPNTKVAIAKWLKTLAGTSAIAIEATNVYHVLFADMAYEAGCEVYVLDGYQLSSYRKSVNIRAKTDAQDARLLARYLKNEFDELRPWIPPSPLYRQLLSLFRRRAALVQARTGLVQSWANETLLKTAFANQINSMKRLEALVEKKIRDVLQEAGLMVQVNRC